LAIYWNYTEMHGHQNIKLRSSCQWKLKLW